MKEKSAGIIISTVGLKDGAYDFLFSLSPAELSLPDNFTETVNAAVQVEKLRQRFILRVRASTGARFACDRCLDEIILPIQTEFDELCTLDAEEMRQVGEEEEVKLLNPNEHSIDVTEDVREYLLVAVPLRKICGEDAEGKPLCRNYHPPDPPEGTAAVDPRWEGLQGIKLDEKDESKD